jgi:uncharacterized protein
MCGGASEIFVRVHNTTKSLPLGDAILVADDGPTRRTGLLRHSHLAPGEGLWIVPCEGVHTFGMKFAIDVVFLDRKKQILKVRKNMPVRRFSVCLRAHSVLELPAGMIDETGTTTGDVLEFER